MTEVVVLSWDAVDKVIEYVPVNGGSGGAITSFAVSDADAADIDQACAGGALPRVGDLETDGDTCLLELSGPAARRCRARWNRKYGVVLTDPADGAVVEKVAPESIGLGNADVAQQADRIGAFLLFTKAAGGGAGRALGCWEVDGGLNGWIARRAEVLAARAEEKARRNAAKQAEIEKAAAELDAKKRFINPYTFVPFPTEIARQAPAGHRALAPGRLSGTLRVRWEFTTPMQAPEGAADGQRLRLPGASVKGAVRSLHETLAGGCLRVLEQEFVPSYRDSATVPSEERKTEWTLAIVDSVTRDGQPLTVRPSDCVVWVRAGQLQRACGRQLASGSRVSFEPPSEKSSLDRFELPDSAPVSRGGDWVVLLTDAGARRSTTRSGKPGSYFAACGRVRADTEAVEVRDEAWSEFRRAVAGAREVQQARRADREKQSRVGWVPVKFRGGEIGRRKAASGRFAEGDVLWVHRPPGSSSVAALSLSMLWRHAGKGPLGKRVPPHLHACPEPADPEKLCVSCRLFGSADTRGRGGDEAAEQRAYAGHVRFGDAVSPGPVALTPFRRAPMGVPRPGAGQLYLRYDDAKKDDTGPAANEGDPPTREWGAAPDQIAAGDPEGVPKRQVRGRKYYWNADPTVQPVPRHIARVHQTNERMPADRMLAPSGTVLVQTVTFDNLDKAELGSLLATMQPQRVLPVEEPGSRKLRLRLGGGKPLGLGACHATVEDLRVWVGESRYGAAPTIEPDSDRYVAEFVGSVPTAVKDTWAALCVVLAEDESRVDPLRVWYPPGEFWSDQESSNPKVAKQFDEPFAFFTGTSGMYLKKGNPRCLRALPEPTDPDQSLAIIRKRDLGKGTGGAAGD